MITLFCCSCSTATRPPPLPSLISKINYIIATNSSTAAAEATSSSSRNSNQHQNLAADSTQLGGSNQVNCMPCYADVLACILRTGPGVGNASVTHLTWFFQWMNGCVVAADCEHEIWGKKQQHQPHDDDDDDIKRTRSWEQRQASGQLVSRSRAAQSVVSSSSNQSASDTARTNLYKTKYKIFKHKTKKSRKIPRSV